jgi:hypothetical protein
MNMKGAEYLTSRNRLNRRMREEQRFKDAQEIAAKQGLAGKKRDETAAAMIRREVLRHPREEAISDIFGELVTNIREQMREQKDDRGNVIRPAHNAAVDVRLEFRSLDLRRRGLTQLSILDPVFEKFPEPRA